MKEIYYLHYEVKTDGGKWYSLGRIAWCYKETENLIKEFHLQTFTELKEIVEKESEFGYIRYTLFKHRPEVVISDLYRDVKEVIDEKNFQKKNIQLRIVYKQYNPSVKELMHKLTAEEFVEYFTDRKLPVKFFS